MGKHCVQRGYTGQWDDSCLGLDEKGQREILNGMQFTSGFFSLNFFGPRLTTDN